MTTNVTSLATPYARSADVDLFRLTTAPSIATREQNVDQVLADSFPASDPPPWTLGRVPGPPPERTDTMKDHVTAWSSHTTTIIAGGKRSAWQWTATGMGALGIGMLVPISILAIGIAIALAARAVIELAGWVASIV
jgi:hypothetical protein